MPRTGAGCGPKRVRRPPGMANSGRVPALLCLVALAPACITDPGACTTSVEPGIVVEIRDAATGAPMAAQAMGQVEDHRFADSLAAHGFAGNPPVMLSRASAFERPGTYVVTVFAPGYLPWVRDAVEVHDDECHVRTVTLEARLEPA